MNGLNTYPLPGQGVDSWREVFNMVPMVATAVVPPGGYVGGKVLVGGVFKTVTAESVCIGGAWKTVTEKKVCIGGQWKTLV